VSDAADVERGDAPPAASHCEVQAPHNPCDATQLAHLSAVTRVPLQHVRPLSGNACVIQQRAEDVTGLSHGQNTLKCHPVIEWLDEEMIKFWQLG